MLGGSTRSETAREEAHVLQPNHTVQSLAYSAKIDMEREDHDVPSLALHCHRLSRRIGRDEFLLSHPALTVHYSSIPDEVRCEPQ